MIDEFNEFLIGEGALQFLECLSKRTETPLMVLGILDVEKIPYSIPLNCIVAGYSSHVGEFIAKVHYLLGNYSQAVLILEKAVSLDPGSAVINDHLGDAYWRVGRKREARFQWSKALSVKDDYAQGGRQLTEEKIEKGLDAALNKPVASETPSKKRKKNKNSK